MTTKLEIFYGSGHVTDDATYEIAQARTTDDGAPRPETDPLVEFAQEVTRAVVMEEDEAWVGPEMSVKSRFLELLEQHPELTRPQVYMQAVMEAGDAVIGAAVASFTLAKKDDTMMGPPVMRIISGGEMSIITFPRDITLEDFDRMGEEIREALAQAELRGEQKAMAFLMGEGNGTPVGIVRQPELNEKPLGGQ